MMGGGIMNTLWKIIKLILCIGLWLIMMAIVIPFALVIALLFGIMNIAGIESADVTVPLRWISETATNGSIKEILS